jgi:hypothetical protein
MGLGVVIDELGMGTAGAQVQQTVGVYGFFSHAVEPVARAA